MTLSHRHVLIISDIEGSSLCRDYEMSSFMTKSWPEACLGMSLDVAAVVNALFNAGVEHITVKDFHRTGFNIFPEYLNSKASLSQGYKIGPVPGIGDPAPATALMMIGMHAPSGSNGFLAHTLTSRISRIEINGELLSEAELFSSSVAAKGISPIFFSGCPVACHHSLRALDGIHCFPINKLESQDRFDAHRWRQGLAQEAVLSLNNDKTAPYTPEGPFLGSVTMRDGESAAQKVAQRWKLDMDGSNIIIQCETMDQLYKTLMRLCFLTPALEIILPLGIHFFNARGRYGLSWARQRLIKHPPQ